MIANDRKHLVLGTALWGWSIDRRTAFTLLDRFAANGGVYVDAATNYPINKVASDCGKAIRWLEEWLAVNGHRCLKIILKTGAKDNSGGPQSLLSGRHLWQTYTQFRERLGNSLDILSTHWDNHGDTPEDRAAVSDILDCFRDLATRGLGIGLSGIKCPRLYRELAEDLADFWWIEVKENLLSREARKRYQSFFSEAKYLAYGINLGGIKPSGQKKGISAEYRNLSYPVEVIRAIEEAAEKTSQSMPAIRDIFDFSLYHAYTNKHLAGVIVGPSDITQLASTLNLWHEMLQYENL